MISPGPKACQLCPPLIEAKAPSEVAKHKNAVRSGRHGVNAWSRGSRLSGRGARGVMDVLHVMPLSVER